jgi:hypothetical protein
MPMVGRNASEQQSQLDFQAAAGHNHNEQLNQKSAIGSADGMLWPPLRQAAYVGGNFMETRFQVIPTIFLGLYISTIWLTNISLTGFWTDIIFAIFFSVFTLIRVFKNKLSSPWLTITIRTSAIIFSFFVFGFLGSRLNNPFIIDTFKLRSFYFQKVNGRLFNAYFKPVGAYSGGYGNFWITETPMYFPIIEWPVYYERTVHYDFSADIWDGEPVDNYEVVRNYIKDKVIGNDR